jgi:hypothetical protein
VALAAGCTAGGDPESTGVATDSLTLGTNLIVNGDAESGPGITTSSQTVTIPSWTVTGGAPVAIQYGASGGFPSASTPGPSNRGANFFGGGNAASAGLSQNIDVSTLASQIDAGTVHYDLNGWLGGWSNQNDQCSLKVTFLGSSGSSLGSAQIGPVTSSDRGNVTEFLYRDTAGAVPQGTRSVQAVLSFKRSSGTFDDGYADDLSLVFTSTAQDGGQDSGGGSDAAADQASDANDGGSDATSDSGSDSGGGGGDGGTCSTPIPSDPHASQRASCSFTTGAAATSTLPLTPAQQTAIPIKNVIVMMKENRSFDHLLGQLHTLVPAIEPIPAGFTNPGASGGTVSPFHQTSTCISHDPDHQWTAMHNQVDNGSMDGFVKSAASSTGTDGTFALGYYTQADLPFYYWLASTYPVNDRHFASARSGTFPDRNFLLLGTADGVQSTGDGYPLSSTPTIFTSLTSAGVTWGVYSDGSLLSGTLNWDSSHPGTSRLRRRHRRRDGRPPDRQRPGRRGLVPPDLPARDRQPAVAAHGHPLDVRRGRRLLRPRSTAQQLVRRAPERSSRGRQRDPRHGLHRARRARPDGGHLAVRPRRIHVARGAGAYGHHALHRDGVRPSCDDQP